MLFIQSEKHTPSVVGDLFIHVPTHVTYTLVTVPEEGTVVGKNENQEFSFKAEDCQLCLMSYNADLENEQL